MQNSNPVPLGPLSEPTCQPQRLPKVEFLLVYSTFVLSRHNPPPLLVLHLHTSVCVLHTGQPNHDTYTLSSCGSVTGFDVRLTWLYISPVTL